MVQPAQPPGQLTDARPRVLSSATQNRDTLPKQDDAEPEQAGSASSGPATPTAEGIPDTMLPAASVNPALRDAWLAEMWPTVPEYRFGDRPRPYRSRT